MVWFSTGIYIRIGASKTLKPFTTSQVDLLRTYSGYISGLLTNYLKREEERILIERLFTVASQSDLMIILEETAQTIPIVIDGSHCSIFLKDDDGNFCLESTSSPHLQPHMKKLAHESCLKYKPGEGKTGRVALNGNSIRVKGDIKSEAGKSPELCECGIASHAFLSVAIKEKHGSPVGVLRVVRDLHIGEEFDKDDQLFLENFGQKLYKCLNIHGYFTKGTCFVIMPFNDDFNDIYNTIIKPTVEEFDFICMREDEYSPLGLLTQGIISHIANASIIIADVTGNNPNVYYELGIAHTLEKTVILLSQTDVPADIRHWKYINYKDLAGAAKKISDNIAQAINEAITSGIIKTVKKKLKI